MRHADAHRCSCCRTDCLAQAGSETTTAPAHRRVAAMSHLLCVVPVEAAGLNVSNFQFALPILRQSASQTDCADPDRLQTSHGHARSNALLTASARPDRRSYRARRLAAGQADRSKCCSTLLQSDCVTLRKNSHAPLYPEPARHSSRPFRLALQATCRAVQMPPGSCTGAACPLNTRATQLH